MNFGGGEDSTGEMGNFHSATDRRNPATRQQHHANTAMRLAKGTPDLMQNLSCIPSAPNVTLLDRRKPKPHPWSHANTTFTEQIYIRWGCIDLSNAPPKWTLPRRCEREAKCPLGALSSSTRTIRTARAVPHA